MHKKVLILTSPEEESSVQVVVRHLHSMETRFVVFQTEEFPSSRTLTLRHGAGGTHWRLSEKTGDSVVVSSEEIGSVWYRRPSTPRSPELNDNRQQQFVVNEARATLWSLYTTTNARWINPPLFGVKLLEDNQFFQLQAARSVGLLTPETIISNDPEDVVRFTQAQKNDVALKSIFRTVLFVDGEVQLLYTNRLREKDVVERAKQVALCPVMIQEYVPKLLELRVTVVGKQAFACAIHSQDSERAREDWRRYDFANVKHEVFNLPQEIYDNLLRLMEKLGIVYGAVDMILTPSNEYVFLEVNPSGQWMWIEHLTGLPISRAIAETLSEVG